MTTAFTPATEKMTQVIFATFRLHGQLIAFGDDLAREFGLTSARWQVMGTIMYAPTSLTVPQVADRLSLSRQAIQRLVNDLVAEDFLKLAENPRHKRSKLLELTPKGRDAYDRAVDKFADWANRVSERYDIPSLTASQELLTKMISDMSRYLEGDER
jgi:DNA-binding MarR family transcriptional regulator